MNKYLERRLSDAGILILREKHGNRYFICNNKDDYCRVAMKIVKERSSEKFCWYGEDLREPDMSLARAKEIIEANDNEAAYQFLDLRSDWEYEGMDIEYGENY